CLFFFSSRRRHTRCYRDWSSDVCSSDLPCPSNVREQGMPGACCTRGLVCNVGERCAHEHTGTAEARRHSLRNGLTAYAALSLEKIGRASCREGAKTEGEDGTLVNKHA